MKNFASLILISGILSALLLTGCSDHASTYKIFLKLKEKYKTEEISELRQSLALYHFIVRRPNGETIYVYADEKGAVAHEIIVFSANK